MVNLPPETTLSLPTFGIFDMDEIQSPPAHRSTPDDEQSGEISDTPSSERRRYQRGGRKNSEKGQRDSRMPPVPKPTMPEDEPAEGETLEEFNDRIQNMKAAKRNGEEETYDKTEPQTNGHHYEEHDEEPEQDAEESDAVCDKCKQKPAKKTPMAAPAPAPRENPFETGIRAFNVKRAQNSGGRPISVRASGSEKGKKSAKSKKKSKRKAKKVESSSEEDSDDDDE